MRNRCIFYRLTPLLTLMLTPCFPSHAVQDRLHGWKTERATTALELVAVDESEEYTTFHLRNVSHKVITAYAVSFQPESDRSTTYSLDCIDDEPSCVAPNGVLKEQFSSKGSVAASARTLRILCVVFQDGTSDGNQVDVAEVTSKRIGLALERERLGSIFASHNENDLDVEGLTRFSDKIGRLPRTPKEAFDSLRSVSVGGVLTVDNLRGQDKHIMGAFFAGVNQARQHALGEVEQLRELPLTVSSNRPASSSRAPGRGALFHIFRQRYADHSAKTRVFYQGIQKTGRRPQ